MDRQLSVWAAPGLILFLALLAFVFGHPPGAGAPSAETARAAEHGAPPPAAEAPPASKPAAVAVSKPKPPAEKPAAPAEQAPAEAAPKPAAEAAPKPEPEPEPEPPAAEPPAQEVTKTGDGPTGRVVGRIVFEGAPPEPAAPFTVGGEQFEACCGEAMDRSDRTLRVSADGGVADVVVTIKAEGAPAEGAGKVVEMDQKCCRFEPPVLLVPAGATVRYKNSDGTVHNVHVVAKKNPKPNNNVAPGSTMDVDVPKDEEITVICDIHTWMKASVVVVKYATAGVSGLDGGFEIEGVPPGEWSVELWGERVKPVDKKLKIKVEAGATTTVEWRVAATASR